MDRSTASGLASWTRHSNPCKLVTTPIASPTFSGCSAVIDDFNLTCVICGALVRRQLGWLTTLAIVAPILVVSGLHMVQLMVFRYEQTHAIRLLKFTFLDLVRIHVLGRRWTEAEALGFKSLLELGEPAYTIANIAARAGKSEAYV